VRRRFIVTCAIVSLIVGAGWQAIASAGGNDGGNGSNGHHHRYPPPTNPPPPPPKYGPNAAMITTSSSVTYPLGVLLVNGVNFISNEGIVLTLSPHGEVLATTTSDGVGSFANNVVIPSNTVSGTYSIVATGADGDSASTKIMVQTKSLPPTITSPSSTSATVGQSFSFQVTATGFPTPSFSESGFLPHDVTFSPTGVLSGTPHFHSGGIYPITITATNTAGSDTQKFFLKVDEAPVITSASSTSATVGKFFSFQVTATGIPAPSFSESGALPGTVTLSPSGTLSGTPAGGSKGTYPITITATNTAGSNVQSFVLTVAGSSGHFHHGRHGHH